MTKGTWVYIYLISKGHLPPEGARKKKIIPWVLEIDSHIYIYIYIYILKLNDTGYLDKYISFPKGVSILKM